MGQVESLLKELGTTVNVTVAKGCCAVAEGATRKERIQGTVATGRWRERMPMGENVWCHQMNVGEYPGNKFLQFTPTGVAGLVAAKRSKNLYMDMKVAIDLDAGGQEPTGWDWGEVYKVTKNYEEDFALRGIRMRFCMTSYWGYPEDGSPRFTGVYDYQAQYQAWLEFADMSKLTLDTKEPQYAYKPEVDYSNPER